VEHEALKNFWLNNNAIDKALMYLGYNKTIIDRLNEKQKRSIIIDEYLYQTLQNYHEPAHISVEDMAEYLIDCQRK
jgi:hypothetical protein